MTAARLQSRDGQLLMPDLAVFQANVTATISLTTSYVEQADVYNEVTINRGNCYNSSTGRFTAPTAGIYQFGVASIAGNTNDVYRFDFYKNGVGTEYSLRISTNATGSEYQNNASMEVYIELEAGDYISVFAKSDAGNDAYGSSNYRYSFFHGRFIA